MMSFRCSLPVTHFRAAVERRSGYGGMVRLVGSSEGSSTRALLEVLALFEEVAVNFLGAMRKMTQNKTHKYPNTTQR